MMNTISKIISYASLAGMVILPVLVFQDTISIDMNKTLFLVLTITWFVTAPVWMLRKEDKN